MKIEDSVNKYTLHTNGRYTRVEAFYSSNDCRVTFNCGWQDSLLSKQPGLRFPYIELDMQWDNHGNRNEIKLNGWMMKVEAKNVLQDTINDSVIHPDANIKFIFIDPNGSKEEHIINTNIQDIADNFKLFCSYSNSRSLTVAKYELEIAQLKYENEILSKEVNRLRNKLATV